MTSPSPALEYEAGDSLRRRRRRRRAAWLVAVLGLVLLGVWRGPAAARRLHLVYREHKAESYRAPPDRVVYEEDPGCWPALLGQPNYRMMKASSPGWNPFVASIVPEVERLARAGDLRLGGTAVFCHARKTPSGRDRLVVVWLANNGVRCNAQGATPDNQVQIEFHTSVVDGGTVVSERFTPVWVAPQSVAENRQTPLYARLFAGQPAIADPTHFTIAFDLDLYNDVIDGYLRDDDTVILRPRNHDHPLNPK